MTGTYTRCSNINEPVSSTEARNQKTGPVCTDKLLNSIIEQYSLNPQQRIAFSIIAKQFLLLYNKRREQGNPFDCKLSVPNPLQMLLTGPGGTGKSHVVNVVKTLMASHRYTHCIRLLAPTGSAASIIGGATIHTGL